MRDTLRTVAGASMAAAIALTGALADAGAQERVRWRMQSAWGSNTPVLGTTAVEFAERINAMSGGNFDIKFHEPGTLVPSLQGFDAVSRGAVDSAWTTPGYHNVPLGPAVAFFTAVPFGPELGEFLAWKWFGGGNELREELYNPRGATAVDSFCIGPETAGWFRVEVENPEEFFRTLAMRFYGLGAEVMQKMGVSTRFLSAPDIFPALERGAIDAAEFSMPSTDIKLGFHQIAKFNYFPGWHQRVSCSELLMNRAKWDALPPAYQTMIRSATAEQAMLSYVETEAANPVAMQEMIEAHGVNVRRWDDATLARLERAWLEVVAEHSAEDPTFRRVADSYFAFRKIYRTWGDAQSLRSTYQQALQ